MNNQRVGVFIEKDLMIKRRDALKLALAAAGFGLVSSNRALAQRADSRN